MAAQKCVRVLWIKLARAMGVEGRGVRDGDMVRNWLEWEESLVGREEGLSRFKDLSIGEKAPVFIGPLLLGADGHEALYIVRHTCYIRRLE